MQDQVKDVNMNTENAQGSTMPSEAGLEKPAQAGEPVSPTLRPEIQTPASVQLNEVPNITQPGGKKTGKKMLLFVFLFLLLGVAVVVVGFFSGSLVRQQAGEPETQVREEAQPVEEEDKMTQKYLEQSDSNETSSIEKDLNDTSFEGIEQEMAQIEQEMASE